MASDLKERLFNGEHVFGTWLSLGSHTATEVVASAGFDWVVIDLEHGLGDYGNLVCQLQALQAASTVPLVRVTANDPAMIKRALDMGARGVIVPLVNSAEEATKVVEATKYPPAGMRGVARTTRAAGFGSGFDDYFASANDTILTMVQIETARAVENVFEIAKVEGVDALFVGPLDLSTSLGVQNQLDHPKFVQSLERIGQAAREEGKILGILVGNTEQAMQFKQRGYRLIGVSSDMVLLNTAARELIGKLRRSR